MNSKIIPPPYKTISFFELSHSWCRNTPSIHFRQSPRQAHKDNSSPTHIYVHWPIFRTISMEGKMKSIFNIHQLCCNTLQPKFFSPIATGRALRLLGMHRND
ncbi:hypothetical protein CEXT_92591 [Caerostris extrusa]|uniref:Uncharacterized protein n=1 Tax=Caerostris extrusa TaxID=172846 RepID=A0AAV4XBY7_CAEEX|nr:hypothetical protein CEXT_92591 [Caerostris extrusa]